MASSNQCANETLKSVSVNGVDNSDLPNTFNSLVSCSERSDRSLLYIKKKSCKALNEIVTCQECVIVQFKRVRIRKAAGLDVICGYTLHSCADEQTNRVFTRL